MPSIDFSNEETKEKTDIKNVDWLGLASKILLGGSLVVLIWDGWGFIQKKNLQEEVDALEAQKKTQEYKEAAAFKAIESDIKEAEGEFLGLGNLLIQIREATDEGVVYKSVTYEDATTESEGKVLVMEGVFQSLDLVKSQIEKYQEIENDRVKEVTYGYQSVDSNNLSGQETNLNALDYQGVEIKFVIK